MANLEGMEMKFFGCVKQVDFEKYLSPKQKLDFVRALDSIDAGRIKDGKDKASEKSYLVINTDEPYADEVIAILKKHGHWG